MLKKDIFYVIERILYNNYHSLTIKLSDILLLIKYIIENSLFYK